MMRLKPIIFSLALLGTAPAFATGPATDDIPVRRVSYADLNLASEAGRVSLRHRVNHAIVEVCGDAGGITLSDRALTNACKRQALTSVNRQITVAVADATTNRSGGEMLIAVR